MGASACSNQSVSKDHPRFNKLAVYMNLPSLYDMVTADAFVLCNQIFLACPDWFDVGTSRQVANREKAKYPQLLYNNIKKDYMFTKNNSSLRTKHKKSLVFKLDKAAREFVEKEKIKYDNRVANTCSMSKKVTPVSKISEFNNVYNQVFNSNNGDSYKVKMNTFILINRNKLGVLEMLDRIGQHRTPSLREAKKRLLSPIVCSESPRSDVWTPVRKPKSKRLDDKKTPPFPKHIPCKNSFSPLDTEPDTKKDTDKLNDTLNSPVKHTPKRKRRTRRNVDNTIGTSAPVTKRKRIDVAGSTNQMKRKRVLVPICDFCKQELVLPLDDYGHPVVSEMANISQVERNHLMKSCSAVSAKAVSMQRVQKQKYQQRRGASGISSCKPVTTKTARRQRTNNKRQEANCSNLMTRMRAIAALCTKIGQKGYTFKLKGTKDIHGINVHPKGDEPSGSSPGTKELKSKGGHETMGCGVDSSQSKNE